MRSSTHPLFVLFALLFPTISTAQVVVNEVMYVPNAPEPEWIELHNASDTAVPITGWTVQDRTAARPVIPAGIVPAKGYLVLARDTEAFRTARPSDHSFPLIQVAIPSLNNTGDDVILRDADGNTVDSVSWSSSWGGTGGISLERITAAHPANERESWRSAVDSTGGTPGRRNSTAPAARDLAIRTLSFDPDAKVVRVVIGNVGVEQSVGATISLYHDENNDTLGTPSEAQSGESIPQIPPGDSLTIALRWNRPLTAYGEQGLLVIDHPDDERPGDNIGIVLVREKFVDTGVIVNEFIYAPAAPEPEWAELYNRGSFPVDLTGWVLHDAGAGRPKIGPAFLLPGDYLVLTRDTAALREVREDSRGLLQFSLPSLNNGSDNIVLRNRNGVVVDSIGYRSSWGGSNGRSVERRLPDMRGSDSTSWGSSADPARGTPGRQNSLVPPNVNLALDSAAFNRNSGEVRITVANTGLLSASGATLILYRDANGNDIGESDEETARLDLPSLKASDSITETFLWNHPLLPEGETGILLLQLDGDEHPGDDTARVLIRQPVVDTGLIVNEIMYDPNDPEPEWLELYNRGAFPVDLAGWRIADGSGSSGPLASAILLPGEYILVTPDTVALKASRHAASRSIRLLLPAFNNSGDGVVLRNPSGAAIDSFRYASGWGGADGVSLERKAFDFPSADPASWTSATNSTGGTPGTKNSWEPILRDLALGILSFDPDALRVTATVYNRGLEEATSAEAILRFDPNGNGTSDPGDELRRTPLPSILPDDSAEILLQWSRPLTLEGEEGVIEIVFSGDQRPEDNRGEFRADLPPIDTGVVVNEIMYNPNSPEPEWLELYNRGRFPVRLKGWKIRDGSTSSQELPEFTLPPEGYAIITSDSAELRRLREIPTGTTIQILHPAFNNSGDRVVLINPSGESVDEFTYTSAWGGSDGSAMERKNANTTADDPQNWKSSADSTGATPGRENSALLPEKNIALRQLLFDPVAGAVYATVVNTGEEPTSGAEAILHYDADRDGLARPDEEVSRAEIPSILPLDSAVIVLLWSRPLTAKGEPGIVLLSMDGDRSRRDDSGTFSARTQLADDGIVVNEIMYAPVRPEPEWIELFNAGTLPVDLEGWGIGDAGSEQTLPAAVIEPETFLVLTADTTAFRSARESSSPTIRILLPSLNNSGDAIILRNSSGTAVDSLYYAASWGGDGGRSLERRRATDRGIDSTSWRSSVDSTGGTPGRENSVHPPERNLALDSVSFNIVSADVIATVRNGGNEEIAGAELILYYDRNENGSGEKEEEIARTVLPLFVPDGTAQVGLAWPRLLTDEGEIALAEIEAKGDQVEEDNRVERILQRPPLDTGLVISEIMFDPLPRGALAGSEYLEVYNPNNRPIPLAGWKIADGPEETVIPENAPVVRPGAFAVIAADSGIYDRFPFLGDSTNVLLLGTNLGLNNTEDDALLRNPRGAMIDSIRYNRNWHWNRIDDTKGISLERLALGAEGNDSHHWSSSVARYGGTPGGPNSRQVAAGTASADIAAEPPRISPDGDGFEDFTRISYRLPPGGGRVVLSIYDRHGRRVARPLNNELSAAEGNFIWDGTDDDGTPLPIGIYILRVESYAADGSGTKTAQTVITVARRL